MLRSLKIPFLFVHSLHTPGFLYIISINRFVDIIITLTLGFVKKDVIMTRVIGILTEFLT
jgi:hypothetical protein